MAIDKDILIVGGGLNGATLAVALASAGFSVAVLEAQKPRTEAGDFDGRGYALAHASVQLLRVLGLWDSLKAVAQPMLEIKVTDGKPGQGAAPFFMHFDHASIEEGPMGYMVEDRHLRPVLLDALGTGSIDHISGVRVVAQHADIGKVTVTLDNGAEMTASLLIGCDGKKPGRGAKRDQTDGMGLWPNRIGRRRQP